MHDLGANYIKMLEITNIALEKELDEYGNLSKRCDHQDL
jgi:hypothetical protein